MRAVCLVLMLSIGVLSHTQSFDNAKDFLEGAYLSFTGEPLENPSCLDEETQNSLHDTLDNLLYDFAQDEPLHVFFNHVLLALPELSSVFENCGIATFVNTIAESIEANGEELFARVSQEYTTIKAIHADMQSQLAAGEFKLAGEQFGNMMKLMIPIGEFQLQQSNLYSFSGNLTLFLEGMAMGFQAKSTPLSKCYNTTTMIVPSFHNALAQIKKCSHLNFTACNVVPAYLTIFNTAVSSIYNDCKIQLLITDIKDLKQPEYFSQVLFTFFTKKVDIENHFNAMIQAIEQKNSYQAGFDLAYIFKVLLKFSIS
ncbi:unnamed protein product [Blepharisma stoltei]|uniref:Uncharacterized protein n=1 Tax=Blepharisma stoltei TaxID=1481888 RepID=A0AAU9IDV4_9CILI|nr:unnamed protein product [Blepharisma stoltei]